MVNFKAVVLIAASFTAGWWLVDDINWELFYPTVRHDGPKLRHVYTEDGKVRWIQKFNKDKKVWENSHIDWIEPPARPMDYRLLTLDHVPNDGQTGNGMPGTDLPEGMNNE